MNIQRGSQTAHIFSDPVHQVTADSHPGGQYIHSSRAIKHSHNCNQIACVEASAAHLRKPGSPGFFPQCASDCIFLDWFVSSLPCSEVWPQLEMQCCVSKYSWLGRVLRWHRNWSVFSFFFFLRCTFFISPETSEITPNLTFKTPLSARRHCSL